MYVGYVKSKETLNFFFVTTPLGLNIYSRNTFDKVSMFPIQGCEYMSTKGVLPKDGS